MMDIITIAIVFILSIIACALGGEVVRRKEIQINRIAMLLFHILYGIGLVAAILVF